ncbi:MAG: glycerate kinase [Prolixibacteraceae bacterium]|nr:glycerate kinase [Prolixibacteraceae bacterium]
MNGKTPLGVALIARKYNIPVIGIAGTLGEGYRELYNEGFQSIFSIVQGPSDLQFCLDNASRLIKETTEQIFRLMPCAANHL